MSETITYIYNFIRQQKYQSDTCVVKGNNYKKEDIYIQKKDRNYEETNYIQNRLIIA